MKQQTKKLIYPVAFLVVVVLSLVYRLISGGYFPTKETGLITTESITETTIGTTDVTLTSVQMCNVYLCGSVNNPGVYSVAKGEILNNALSLAGGLNDDAAIDQINLVYEINSNVSIYIPSVEELKSTIDMHVSDPIIRYNYSNYVWGGSAEQYVSEDSKGELININTADISQLTTLPGIGQVAAQAIIDYRTDNQFNSIEDIKNVSGIGDAKFEKIKNLITV